MFTGIVQAVGRVDAVHAAADRREIRVRSVEIADRLALGDSVALDGVCQTVTALEGPVFTVQAIAETLRVTTLGEKGVGARLNLETAVTPGTPLGGHFVQGHVDGVATLTVRERQGESERFELRADPALVGQLVPKGSVALDGISLTVGPRLTRDRFEVYLIPHTLAHTTLVDRAVGERLNLETDILGKYVLRFLRAGRGSVGGEGLSWEGLRAAGFGPGDGQED